MLQTRRLILLFILLLAGCTAKPELGAIKAEDLLIGKTAQEKATIKGQEIAKIGTVNKTTRADYSIQIVSTSAIEDGVVVLARAWDSNGQIGFGKDGTVDIERFIIHNPPILVQDSAGTIKRTSAPDSDGNTVTYKYKEDLTEALLQVIEHTIKVKKQKFDSSKIVSGKIGSTTSTFYPAAGATSPVDGSMNTVDGAGRTWAGFRDATVADSVSTTETSNNEAIFLETFSSSPNWRGMNRTVCTFDTSSLGTDTIDSATYSLFGTFKADAISLTASQARLSITSASLATTDNLAVGDWDSFGATQYATKAYADYSASAYNDMTLTAAGEAYINKSGVTEFMNMFGADFDDDTPTHPGSQLNSHFGHHYADQTGTTNDPKLVVEHSVSASRRIINF